MNRNKFGVTLNLRHPTGVDMYKRLIAVSDVIIENYAYGVMERLGLDYRTLSKINPKLVCCSLSGFGQTGPDRSLPAAAVLVPAELRRIVTWCTWW